MKRLKNKAVDGFAEARIRLSRGQSLVNDIRNAFIIVATLKIILNLNLFLSIIAIPLVLIIFFLIGFVDIKYIKSFQREQELVTRDYNPHLRHIHTQPTLQGKGGIRKNKVI